MSADQTQSATPMARRTVLAVGVAGVAGAALVGCGGSSDSGSAAASSAPAAGGSTGANPSGAAGGGVSAAQVPTGGAAIIEANDTAYVVAQPTEGTFVAHSAVCPHQGCLCTEVRDGKAVCPCHGSEFNVETGAVEKGPATEGLAPADVSVDGGTLTLS